MIDYKGIAAFLLLTLGVTYAVELTLIFCGLRFQSGIRPTGANPAFMRFVPLFIGLLMWVPGLAALAMTRFVSHEGFAFLNLRFGSRKPYLTTAWLVPVVFIAIYGLTWLCRLGRPDWQMNAFAPPLKVPPHVFLAGIFLASLVLGPVINGFFALGEEIGWRGYLLPKLLPLGKPKAYLILGVVWGLWHAPLIAVGFNYPGYPIRGMVFMAAMTTTFGIFINEFHIRHQSTILAGWIHGAFNGQAYGLWRVLFPSVNPLLGGFTGIIGILVWFLARLLL